MPTARNDGAGVVIEARSVCKHFRQGKKDEVRAVDEVSLRIEAGACALLVGPSGSGKTTLLALLGALERPTRGAVLFEGRDLAGCSDVELARVRRRMGFIFQNFSLIPGLPVWENVTYPLIPLGLGRRERWERARELLGGLGLAEKLDARANELSGGEQQRVAAARALAGRPRVLLADEPTSNLDAAAVEALVKILGDIHRQGTTLVISSHDSRVMGLATTSFEMEGGRLRVGV